MIPIKILKKRLNLLVFLDPGVKIKGEDMAIIKYSVLINICLEFTHSMVNVQTLDIEELHYRLDQFKKFENGSCKCLI